MNGRRRLNIERRIVDLHELLHAIEDHLLQGDVACAELAAQRLARRCFAPADR